MDQKTVVFENVVVQRGSNKLNEVINHPKLVLGNNDALELWQQSESGEAKLLATLHYLNDSGLVYQERETITFHATIAHENFGAYLGSGARQLYPFKLRDTVEVVFTLGKRGRLPSVSVSKL